MRQPKKRRTQALIESAKTFGLVNSRESVECTRVVVGSSGGLGLRAINGLQTNDHEQLTINRVLTTQIGFVATVLQTPASTAAVMYVTP